MNEVHRLLVHEERAYTLVEILVVIAVIGIIAGLTFPLLSRMKRASQKATASREIAEIVNAIRTYQATYNRLPVPRETAGQLSEPVPDMSYGLTNTVQMKGMPLTEGLNTDVISALRSTAQERSGVPNRNRNHVMNPRKAILLKAKDADRNKSPGVGPDGTYYDPWGVPYIITLDVNNDEQCLDAFYGRASVSEGPINSGLQRTFKTARGYEVRGSIMVWSTGPDGTANTEVKANQGVNKDNILSW